MIFIIIHLLKIKEFCINIKYQSMKKIVLLASIAMLFSCKKEDSGDFQMKAKVEKSELQKKADNFFKSISTVPYENISEDKVALGKKLYFDTIL